MIKHQKSCQNCYYIFTYKSQTWVGIFGHHLSCVSHLIALLLKSQDDTSVCPTCLSVAKSLTSLNNLKICSDYGENFPVNIYFIYLNFCYFHFICLKFFIRNHIPSPWEMYFKFALGEFASTNFPSLGCKKYLFFAFILKRIIFIRCKILHLQLLFFLNRRYQYIIHGFCYFCWEVCFWFSLLSLLSSSMPSICLSEYYYGFHFLFAFQQFSCDFLWCIFF